MANEKRLIDVKPLMGSGWHLVKTGESNVFLASMSLADVPTVDAVPMADMKEFASDVAYQFGYYCQNGGRLHLTHGGLSTLEWAFDILGWENPHPVPECECEADGCHEHATCGTPTKDGYKRVCGKHFNELHKEA